MLWPRDKKRSSKKPVENALEVRHPGVGLSNVCYHHQELKNIHQGLRPVCQNNGYAVLTH
jgi:hypothetical protein